MPHRVWLDRQRQRFSLQWLLLILAIIAAGGVLAYSLYAERIDIRQREEDRLLALSRIAHVTLQQNIKSVDETLTRLRAQGGHGKPPADLNQRLVTAVGAMPGVRTIVMLDAAGRIRASSREELLSVSSSFANREYFRRALLQPDPEALFISPPFLTVLGIYSINLTKAIVTPTGEFAGVITATLDPEFITPILESIRVTEDTMASLNHSEGVLYLLLPGMKDIVGRNLDTPGSFFNQHRDSKREATVFSGLVRATQQERMIAQRTVAVPGLKLHGGLVVAVSRRLDAIYRTWQRDAWIAGTAYALLSVLFLVLLASYQRGFKRYLKSEEAFVDALSESEARYRLLAENSYDVIWTMDLQSRRFTYVSPSVKRLRGYTPEEVMALPVEEALTPESAKRVADAMQAMMDRLTAGERPPLTRVTEVDQPHRDGRIIPTEVVTTYILNKEGKPVSILGITRDITERRKAQAELERLANTDTLTGLANRRQFMSVAETELARAQRYHYPLSVFMMDIDHFKVVNDNHGHQTGDRVLKALAELLQDALREVDAVARIGGEEFAALLSHTELAAAMDVANRLRQRVAALAVPMEQGLPLRITLSIGVAAISPTRPMNVDTLLHQADQALYEAKRGGRNQVRSAFAL